MKFKLRAIAIGIATLGLLGGSAASALASPAAPATHRVTPVTTPWTFDNQQSDIAGLLVNDVEGQGALPMFRWHDFQNPRNPAVDTFFRGGNSVTLRHSLLPLPTVSLRSCTVTFSQPNGAFSIIRGTGTGAGLASQNGRFNLQGLISYPLRGGLCPLRFFSPATLLRAIEFRVPIGLPTPTFVDFSVQGRADLFRASISTFAPVSPTGAPSVLPSITPSAPALGGMHS